jgi:hypothetical protein
MDKKEILKDTLNDFNDVFSIPDKIENKEDVKELITKGDETAVPKKNNYAKSRDKMHNKAKKTIDSLFKFYLAESIIDEDDYIRQKSYHEQCTLGDLMSQIEIANRAITTNMESVDAGDMSPRMFEVLSDALRTSMELLKMKSMHFVQKEESMKKLMADREIYQHKSIESGSETSNNDGTVTARGSKKLMQGIQDAIKNEEIEDANIDED